MRWAGGSTSSPLASLVEWIWETRTMKLLLRTKSRTNQKNAIAVLLLHARTHLQPLIPWALNAEIVAGQAPRCTCHLSVWLYLKMSSWLNLCSPLRSISRQRAVRGIYHEGPWWGRTRRNAFTTVRTLWSSVFSNTAYRRYFFRWRRK